MPKLYNETTKIDNAFSIKSADSDSKASNFIHHNSLVIPEDWKNYQRKSDNKSYTDTPIPFIGVADLYQDLMSVGKKKGFKHYSIGFDVDSEFKSCPDKPTEMLTVQLREKNSNSAFVFNISNYDVSLLRNIRKEKRISPLAAVFNARDSIHVSDKISGILYVHASIFFSFKDICALFPYNPEIVDKVQAQCQQNRRITTQKSMPVKLSYYIELKHPDFDNPGWYQVALKIEDQAALLGAVSLNNAAQIVGINMENKNKMDKYKTNMIAPFTGNGLEEGDNPDEMFLDFIKYSASDCITSNIERLDKEKMVPTIYKVAGLTAPKPNEIANSVGSKVAALIESWIRSKATILGDLEALGLSPVEGEDGEKIDPIQVALKRLFPDIDQPDIMTLASQASVGKIVEYDKDSTAIYGIAVNGGRCKNERPTTYSVMDSIIADADISGCYGRGLMNQSYPVGLPAILEFGHGQKKIKLGDLLKKYKKELIPGLYNITVSGKLSFDQDLIFSKSIEPRKLIQKTKKAVLNDDVEVDIPFALYTNEIVNGTINHDILQLIEIHSSDKEKKEWMNLEVVTMYYYPKSLKCDSFDELVSKIVSNNNVIEYKHISKGVYLGGNVKKDLRPRYWVELKLSTLIEPLLDARSKLKKIAKGKISGEKLVEVSDHLIKQLELSIESNTIPKSDANSLQNYIKLVINTVYGTIASPYFNIGNVVVASNITARARALAWTMHVATNSHQSITDGSAYSINKVRFWDKYTPSFGTICRWSKEKSTIQDTKNDNSRYPLKPLAGNGEWLVENVNTETGKVTIKNDVQTIVGNSDNWSEVDDIYHNHIRNLYTNNGKVILDVVNQMSFEHKDLYKSIVCHSQSNYMFISFFDEKKIKCRGQKFNKSVYYQGEELELIEKEHPLPKIYLQIATTGTAPVINKYKVEEILKVNKANDMTSSKSENVVQKYCLTAGDVIYKNSDLNIISLSQFLWKTEKQHKEWQKMDARLKKQLGWGLTAYFYNPDTKVIEYGRALVEIQTAINEGKNWIESISKNQNGNSFKKVVEKLPNRNDVAVKEENPKKFRRVHDDWESRPLSVSEHYFKNKKSRIGEKLSDSDKTSSTNTSETGSTDINLESRTETFTTILDDSIEEKLNKPTLTDFVISKENDNRDGFVIDDFNNYDGFEIDETLDDEDDDEVDLLEVAGIKRSCLNRMSFQEDD
ncbi:MAG: hypothetical protein F6K23_37695 [Okeania sp. SIO2C9]|uniref:hypothetical protein n=1 Tax=Okeania sp. SIO2C9 TaxID=2607791 RepID=UPI0013C1180B|nr:hypothetical protein [Okeania sp. SIO2C9]NEQ78226.1 hypothetical protein [Okeania sp. SIO2C9]